MSGNILLALTALSWIALVIFNFQHINTSGQNMAGWGIIGLVIAAVFGLFSLITTINIASAGGFNWISADASTRKIAVAVIWLLIMTGIVYSMMVRLEWQTDQSTGWVRWLTTPVYFGSVWLPLMMLVPYAVLANPEWRANLSAAVYKIPLVMGCLAGIMIVTMPRIIASMSQPNLQSAGNNETQAFNNSMHIIENEESVSALLYFTRREEDARLREAAVAKIKTHDNWEAALTGILEGNSYTEMYWVYKFLESNAIDHRERFIQPLNKSLQTVGSELQQSMNDPYKNNLGYLDIPVMCKVLDTQFGESRAKFKPNMLKMQEVLETQPVPRHDHSTTQQFNENLNIYLNVITKWLGQ